MKDHEKSKEQLVEEMSDLRLQNASLRQSITDGMLSGLVVEESRRYAESIVETVREPLLVLDKDLKIISANRNFYRTFKVLSGETLGCFIYDLGNKQWDIPKLRELLETILPQNTVFDNYEVEHEFADIGRRVMLLNARQIQRVLGKEQIILLAIEDITERKRLEVLLTDSEERFRRLFETASDGIVLLEKSDGKIAHANPATEKMFGYTQNEIIGNKLQDIGVMLNMVDFQTLMLNLDKSGIINYSDVPIKTKSGQLIATDIYLVDRAHLAQCNIRDITERKRAEGEKAKLEEQLLQAYKMEAIGTLAGGIAHDFNNILAAIIGYTEMAIYGDKKESQKKYLQETMKAAERAKYLVRQILSFSRQDSHEIKPLDFKVLLNESVKFLRASIPTTVEIRQHFTDESCNIMADPTQMHQVIMNLFTNAAHAMKQAGGVLSTELSIIELSKGEIPLHPDLQQGYYVKLTVSDTGHGIDPVNILRIFDPFFTTKTQDEGTGLGLSVVYGIVKSHGGAIHVYSEPGKGTSFNIYLPRIICEEAVNKSVSETVIGGAESILFVDDEPALVDIGTSLLTSLGYKVTGTTSSIEALLLFQAAPADFDLLVTDMTLPKMSGIDLSRKILKIRSDIPIVLCSGIRDSDTEEQVKSLGIRAYCMKPLTRKDLSRVIRETLDARDFEIYKG